MNNFGRYYTSQLAQRFGTTKREEGSKMGNTSTTVLADTTGPSTTVFGVTRSPRVGDPFGGRAPCGAARASADVCPDTRTAGVFLCSSFLTRPARTSGLRGVTLDT